MIKYRSYVGIYVISIWSVVLGIQNIFRLLYTSQAGLTTLTATSAVVYFQLYQWITFAFSISFFAAAFGIWQKANWGRVLFLLTALLFFTLSIIGLFTGQLYAPSLTEKVLLGIRYVLSIGLPIAYLNLPFVKPLFTKTSKEIPDYE